MELKQLPHSGSRQVVGQPAVERPAPNPQALDNLRNDKVAVGHAKALRQQPP
jgi:hypothetical protein